jgi:hypothetical protein
MLDTEKLKTMKQFDAKAMHEKEVVYLLRLDITGR